MIQIKINKIFIGLMALLFLSNCEDEISVKQLNFTNRLVVNALLDNVNKPVVSVSQTIAIEAKDSFPAVANALVIISGNNVLDTLKYDVFTKVYTANTVLQSGKTYQIAVTAPDFAASAAQASAELTMPAAINLTGAAYLDSVGVDAQGFKIGAIDFPIADQNGIKNYYRIDLFTWNTTLAKWDEATVDFFDADLSAAAEKSKQGFVVINDVSFENKVKNIRLVAPYGYANQSPKYKVVVSSLEYSYYTYLKSIDNASKNQIVGIFREAQRVYTNIKNGVGIFAGSTVSEGIIN